MIDFYNLKKGDKVLEIGCGKGYLLVEFYKLGMDVTGIEISEYAIKNAHPEIKPFIIKGDFCNIKFKNKYDLVIAKDCLPHMPEKKIEEVINKIKKISKHSFLEIEVCRNDYECNMLYYWDITHITRKPPEWWIGLFRKLGYSGDFHFKVLIEDEKLGSIDEYIKRLLK